MKIGFEGKCAIELDYREGKTPQLREAKITLDVTRNIEKGAYFTDGLPNKDGVKALSQCFIQGLMVNIRHAHKEGYWKEADHLRYVIDELQRSFVALGEIDESTYPTNFK